MNELKKLSHMDLIGQLISHAHMFGDVVQITDDFVKELMSRLCENDMQPKSIKEKIKILRYNMKYHMEPYNLEDRGETISLINDLIKYVEAVELKLESKYTNTEIQNYLKYYHGISNRFFNRHTK